MKSNQQNDSQSKSNWYFPTDLGCLLFSWIWIAAIGFLAGGLLSLISKLKSANVLELFYAALSFAVVGTILLFFARLPLYRQRQFFTFGPKHLDGIHKKLYWSAYTFVIACLFLLAIVWFLLK
jgi:hypothetical protein